MPNLHFHYVKLPLDKVYRVGFLFLLVCLYYDVMLTNSLIDALLANVCFVRAEP